METTYIDNIKDIMNFIENTDLSNSHMEIIQVNLAYFYPEYKNESYKELYQYVRNFLSNDDNVEDNTNYTNNEYMIKTLNILMKRRKCILLTDIIMDDKRVRIHYDKMGD